MTDVPRSQPSRRDLSLAPVPPPFRREQQFDESESVGLFIGVRQFHDDKGLAEIPFAVDDAIDLAWTFAVDLQLVTVGKVQLCLGGEPSKESSRERLLELTARGAQVQGGRRPEIFKAIRRFGEDAGPNGLMVASLATHGFETDSVDYFLVGDSLRSDAHETAITLATLENGFARRREVRRRILLIDTCRERLERGDTRRIGSGMRPQLAEALSRVEGTVMLSGATGGGYSYDDHQAGNGVFTAAVIDGLRGGAPSDDDGFLRAGPLARFVEERVIAWLKQNNPNTNQVLGIGKRLDGAAESLPLAFDESKWSARREAERLAAERDLAEAANRAEEEARARADEQARRAAADAERRAAEAAVAERIRLARQRIAAAAAVDDAVADRLGAITSALRDWPADRRHRLLTEIEAMDPENPRLRHYFVEVAWKQSAPDWVPAGSSSDTAAAKVVSVPPSPRAELPTPSAPKTTPRPPSIVAKLVAALVVTGIMIGAGVVLYDELRPPRKLSLGQPPLPAPTPTALAIQATTLPPIEPANPRIPPGSESPKSGPSVQPKLSLSAPGSKPGDRVVLTVNGVEFAFVWCPPGTFKLGSAAGEEGRYPDEGPQTEVTLTRGFWMGETEVTQQQWKAIMGEDPASLGFPGNPKNPVEGVSWNDIMGEHSGGFRPSPKPGSFLARLNSASGQRFTLPTEAQWEYACRAGTSTRYSFGNSESPLGDHVWFSINSNGKSQRVGAWAANSWGLYDMHGSVWEWCLDTWTDSYAGGQQEDYSILHQGSFRVNRGGSWRSPPRDLRSAFRSRFAPGGRGSYLGFRLCLPS